MRVGLVSPYDLAKPGGVQDQVIRLAEWLRAGGHESVMIGPGPDDAAWVPLGPSVTITMNGAAAPICLDPRVGGKIEEAASTCDILHVHEPLMPMVGVAASRVTGPALVGTFHADPSPTVRRLYRLTAPVARRVLSRYDALSAVSPVAASALPFVAPTLIPNGIDVGSFSPSPGVPGLVAFLGRDDPRKGLDLLLAAWPIVRGRLPEAELVVGGARRDVHLDGVRFLGRVGDDEKRALLSEASVFCAPNLGGESFGIVLLEAMASSCAVIASALPAFVHVVGDAGVLAKPGDVDGLAAVLVDVLRDDGRRSDLQRRSRERVERFDRRAVVEAYVDLYAAAADRRRSRT